jgi:hypothetical protein
MAKSGCQPANTSTWLSFSGQGYMFRTGAALSYNNHVAAATALGGYMWAPWTRMEQVHWLCWGSRGPCAPVPLSSLARRLQLRAGITAAV